MGDFPELFPLCPVREIEGDLVYFCYDERKRSSVCERHRRMARSKTAAWDGLEVTVKGPPPRRSPS